ncbi:nucleotidyl transferase AbiEii/AbiGii toxin family protein [Oryzomonas sagensis]|uniref:Nucleotidyl transferase AbiEii/AbiGii toxin family protein n=1 Tax=Oryzomonas sagensis TaxID=2603857 RepID=A0ABQ6TL94_9BACT|nr:nucleotidyl transferase AbiEii/AbiGii toxin family protein [Oryzomonas sagensis]KAB0669034.1 nucleotidyl transferase AbiEii/AbiGii toxin family protein [Oryzomonas sagensis]
MDKVANLSAKQRSDLFSETAARRDMTPAIVEKDFWVTWTLDKLFAHTDLSRILMFKGGTSLSKVFSLIDRFSEDIDLILDWTTLTGEDPKAARSKSKQQKLNKDIDERGQAYIATELLRQVSECVGPICRCEVDGGDPNVLNISYPAAFDHDYLRPEVRLEIGPLASWLPYANYTIHPYTAEVFPAVFERSECPVKAIKAERTFWEKATILHHEAYRPAGSPQPLRYSRHYYDLAKMATSSVKNTALADLDLLSDVVEFKDRFYPRGWARYDLAKPGTLRLVPKGHVLESVTADYRDMRSMIFGEYPDIGTIMSALVALEGEINGSI